jgi:biopolymer transport protein ExbB
MEMRVSHRRFAFGLTAGFLLLPGVAHAWWSEDWTKRKLFQIDTGPAGANVTEAVGPSPVLVRLHPGNFKFDGAKPDGSDLRFIASDDKTPLKHHVEKFDSLLGEALIWVGVPELKPGSKADLWLYYGNEKAAVADDAKGTYDGSTALVYHFAERGQPPKDSGKWAIHAAGTGESTEAIIGDGLRLGGGAPLEIPASPTLAWAAGAKATWSLWIKPADEKATGVLLSRREGGSALVLGVEDGKPYVQLESDSQVRRAVARDELAANRWHHLAVAAGEAIALYVDGHSAEKIGAALPSLSGPIRLGGDAAPAAAEPAGGSASARAQPRGFKGDVDELQMASAERPEAFLRAAFASQGADGAAFLAAGQDEEKGSGGGGYFTVILRSVTVDGWVVIGLLGAMAFVSWLVMISKASYLGAVERANDYFSERFRHLGADLKKLVAQENSDAQLGEPKILQRSPLHRIFKITIEEVGKRMAAARPLSAEAIESIRASMDAGLVRENQRLSERMVLLTIAISGGPFLGLLGTVVGVMITFASIAAAGDVNVNAIAPGIAAALVATVAGLAVAIPALFGYNWLLTRIKNATAAMQVFADELVTRLAEAYSERAAAAPSRPLREASGDWAHREAVRPPPLPAPAMNVE